MHAALVRSAVEGRGRLRKSFYKRLFERSLYNHAALMHAIADAEYIRAHGVRSPVVSAVNGIDVKSIPAVRWGMPCSVSRETDSAGKRPLRS